MSCPVVQHKQNLLLGKYINFNCTYNFKSSLPQWSRVKVSHPLTKSIINNLKQEGALGKQNVTAACPKDKLEFIFFFKPFEAVLYIQQGLVAPAALLLLLRNQKSWVLSIQPKILEILVVTSQNGPFWFGLTRIFWTSFEGGPL